MWSHSSDQQHLTKIVCQFFTKYVHSLWLAISKISCWLQIYSCRRGKINKQGLPVAQKARSAKNVNKPQIHVIVIESWQNGTIVICEMLCVLHILDYSRCPGEKGQTFRKSKCHFGSMYRVSHSKEGKVILLWWGFRFWFLLTFLVLHVHEKGTFLLNSSVFIFLMLRALYRMICKNAKSFFGKNSLNVSNVKLFSTKKKSTYLTFLCLFGEKDSLHFTF
jgi:hypothetical protein